MTPEELISSGWQERLTRQEASLDELRRRAVQLLTASLLVTGLFAAVAADVDGWRSLLKVSAIAALLTVVLLVSIIEWPRTFEFDQDTSAITDLIAKFPGHYTADEVALSLAKGREESWNRNRLKLDRLHRYFTWALIAAGIQSLLWAAVSTF